MTDDIYSMTKAGFHEAIRQAKEQAWDECEAASYEIQLEPNGKFWQPYKVNPYRQAH
jgi:hypothetical protein